MTPGPVLYSTNAYLKLFIQEKFYGDVHYVWVSEMFDATKAHAYVGGAASVPPSSDPAAIYRDLRTAIDRGDTHCAKIKMQRASFRQRAAKSFEDAVITEAQRDEIFYLVKHAEFKLWRPLIYVIPRAPLGDRLKVVPAKDRAGLGDEFTVLLKRPEFDVIEPPPC